MKKYLLSFLFCVLSFTFTSCDKEGDEIGDENAITFEILSNDKNASLLSYCEHEQRSLRVSNGYKYSYKTDFYKARCTVECEDKYNKITIKGYVNGKLKETKEGFEFVDLTIILKERK